MRIAIVKAARDLDAGVWYVEHTDVAGLHVEGETFDEFCDNAAAAVADLLEGESGGAEIPIEIIAHTSVRARVAAGTNLARRCVTGCRRPAAHSCVGARATTMCGRQRKARE